MISNDLGANKLGGETTWGRNDLGAKRVVFHTLIQYVNMATCQGLNFIAAIAIEGEQNAVVYCGNDCKFLLYSVIVILFTMHYYILILEFRC